MRTINILVAVLSLLLTSSCEELDFDFRKIEVTVNKEIWGIESFETNNASFDVTYNRGDLLSYFDIDRDATVKKFKLKNIQLFYQSCEDNEADSVQANLSILDSSGLLGTLAKLKGVDLNQGIPVTIDNFEKLREFDLKKSDNFFGAFNLAINSALNSFINNPSNYMTFRLDSQHFPNNANVCGAFLIRMDLYVVYEECRMVPYGSKAGTSCDE